ncbi:unnamed protein product [Boreogadus saida]
MGGPPEELWNGLLDDTKRQSSRTNSTRVVASMVPVEIPKEIMPKEGQLHDTWITIEDVPGIHQGGWNPSPVDHSKVAKSATRNHASHCKRAPSPTTKVTIRPNPLGRHPTLKPG